MSYSPWGANWSCNRVLRLLVALPALVLAGLDVQRFTNSTSLGEHRGDQVFEGAVGFAAASTLDGPLGYSDISILSNDSPLAHHKLDLRAFDDPFFAGIGVFLGPGSIGYEDEQKRVQAWLDEWSILTLLPYIKEQQAQFSDADDYARHLWDLAAHYNRGDLVMALLENGIACPSYQFVSISRIHPHLFAKLKGNVAYLKAVGILESEWSLTLDEAHRVMDAVLALMHTTVSYPVSKEQRVQAFQSYWERFEILQLLNLGVSEDRLGLEGYSLKTMTERFGLPWLSDRSTREAAYNQSILFNWIISPFQRNMVDRFRYAPGYASAEVGVIALTMYWCHLLFRSFLKGFCIIPVTGTEAAGPRLPRIPFWASAIGSLGFNFVICGIFDVNLESGLRDETDPLRIGVIAALRGRILMAAIISVPLLFNQILAMSGYVFARENLGALKKLTHEPWHVPGYFDYFQFHVMFERSLTLDEIGRDPESFARHYRRLVESRHPFYDRPDKGVRVFIDGGQLQLVFDSYFFDVKDFPAIGSYVVSVVEPPVLRWVREVNVAPTPPVPVLNVAFPEAEVLAKTLAGLSRDHVSFAQWLSVFRGFKAAQLGVESAADKLDEHDVAVRVRATRLDDLRKMVLGLCSTHLVSLFDVLPRTLSEEDSDILFVDAPRLLENQALSVQLRCIQLRVRVKACADFLKEKEPVFTDLDQIIADRNFTELDRSHFKLNDLKQAVAHLCLVEADKLLKAENWFEKLDLFDSLLSRADLYSTSSKNELDVFLKAFAIHYRNEALALMRVAPLLDYCSSANHYFTRANACLEKLSNHKDLIQTQVNPDKHKFELQMKRSIQLNDYKDRLDELVRLATALFSQMEKRLVVFSDAVALLMEYGAEAMAIKEQLWGDEIALDDFAEDDFKARPDLWAVVLQIREILNCKDLVDQICANEYRVFVGNIKQLRVMLPSGAEDVALRVQIQALWELIQASRHYLGMLLSERACVKYQDLTDEMKGRGFSDLVIAASVVAASSMVEDSGVLHKSSGRKAKSKVVAKAVVVEIVAPVVKKVVDFTAAKETLCAAHAELKSALDKFEYGDNLELLHVNLNFLLIRWFEALLKTDLTKAAHSFARQMRNHLAHPSGSFKFEPLKNIALFLREHEKALVQGSTYEDRPKVAQALKELSDKKYFEQIGFAFSGDLLGVLIAHGQAILDLKTALNGVHNLEGFVNANPGLVGAAAYAVIYWVEAFAKESHRQDIYQELKGRSLLEKFDQYFSGLFVSFRSVRNVLAHEPDFSLLKVAQRISNFNKVNVERLVGVFDFASGRSPAVVAFWGRDSVVVRSGAGASRLFTPES